ncbi:MAG: MazG nucleotide pyrophosphohydrolase domain-containing protein [Zavarzinella sp.]
MKIVEFQRLIEDTFGHKDHARGVSGTFMWLMEEIGELAEALRGNHPRESVAAEFADVFAWLATLANIAEVDLQAAITAKYGQGCPACQTIPCVCGSGEKP